MSDVDDSVEFESQLDPQQPHTTIQMDENMDGHSEATAAEPALDVQYDDQQAILDNGAVTSDNYGGEEQEGNIRQRELPNLM